MHVQTESDERMDEDSSRLCVGAWMFILAAHAYVQILNVTLALLGNQNAIVALISSKGPFERLHHSSTLPGRPSRQSQCYEARVFFLRIAV